MVPRLLLSTEHVGLQPWRIELDRTVCTILLSWDIQEQTERSMLENAHEEDSDFSDPNPFSRCLLLPGRGETVGTALS